MKKTHKGICAHILISVAFVRILQWSFTVAHFSIAFFPLRICLEPSLALNIRFFQQTTPHERKKHEGQQEESQWLENSGCVSDALFTYLPSCFRCRIKMAAVRLFRIRNENFDNYSLQTLVTIKNSQIQITNPLFSASTKRATHTTN